MEEIQKFLNDEKRKAEQRIHSCELFLNDSTITSISLREGLSGLLQNAEDDYGTLLHLTKVVQMKNSGDTSKLFQNIPNRDSIASNYGTSLPANIGWPIHKPQTVIRETNQRPKKIEFSKARKPIDDFTDFEFDEDVETNGDDLEVQEELVENKRNRKKLSVKEEVEEEEDNDFFDENTAYPSDKLRQRRLSDGLGMARSLPLSVPIHKHPLLSKTDAQDEFDDISDIPNKIAELARSVHGGDIFGELPSPRRQQKVG